MTERYANSDSTAKKMKGMLITDHGISTQGERNGKKSSGYTWGHRFMHKTPRVSTFSGYVLEYSWILVIYSGR